MIVVDFLRHFGDHSVKMRPDLLKAKKLKKKSNVAQNKEEEDRKKYTKKKLSSIFHNCFDMLSVEYK